jgi:hypothetical protein
LRPLWLATNELQQGFAVGEMGLMQSFAAPSLVLHMSMHYHSPFATISGPVHDSNDH